MPRKHEQSPARDERDQSQPAHRVRLPGFLVEGDVGLGDVIKRATYAVGLTPCGGCQRRAATLNRWLGFTGRRRG